MGRPRTGLCVLTLIRPGLLREHVVGEGYFVGLRVLVFLQRDEGFGLEETERGSESLISKTNNFLTFDFGLKR